MSQIQAAVDELERTVAEKVEEHPKLSGSHWLLEEYVVLPSLVSETLKADTHLEINISQGSRAFFTVIYGDGQPAKLPLAGGLFHHVVYLDRIFKCELRVQLPNSQMAQIVVGFIPKPEFQAAIFTVVDPELVSTAVMDTSHLIVRPLDLADIELIEMCLDQF